MIRCLLLCALAITSTGCGVVIDLGYLLSDGHTRKSVEQRKPTGHTETGPERRLAFEGSQVRVACEDVTRSVDRVWNVEKTYEYQGGFYQAHWLPVLLEGIIGGALALGISLKCNEPGSDLNCSLLYGTIPFGVDVAYSLVRLMMIDPPKLIDKQAGPARTEHNGTAANRAPVLCDPDTMVVASAPAAGSVQARVWAAVDGQIAAEDQLKLITYARTHPKTQLAVFSGPKQVSVDLGRCEFFRAMNDANPQAVIPQDCGAR